MPGTTRLKQAALRRKPSARTGAARPRHSAPVAVAGVTLTHPDRVYWQDAEVTKRRLADYYAQVWDWMRPHVTGRVLALVRCPEGASGECFFQKHASAGIDTSHLHQVQEPTGDKSISIDDLEGLIALVQAGVLEVHLRGSTVDHLEEANRLVFDLDPGPGVEWPALVAAAREVRQRLRDRKLESFVKVTGGKGAARGGADPIRAMGRGQGVLSPHRHRNGLGRSRALHRDGEEGRAEPSHLRRLSAQQPRGDGDRALFDAGTARRDRGYAAVVGGVGRAERGRTSTRC